MSCKARHRRRPLPTRPRRSPAMSATACTASLATRRRIWRPCGCWPIASAGASRGTGFDDLRGASHRCCKAARPGARTRFARPGRRQRQSRGYDSDKARPKLASGKESGSVEYDADAVFLLSEDKEYDGPPLAPGLFALRLELAKSRYGPKGVIPLYFSPAGARYTSRAQPCATLASRATR